MEFFTDTYEEPVPRGERLARVDTETTDAQHLTRGRPKNGRFPYQSNHPKHGVVQRVMRSFGHNNLPNIIGRFFPRRDDRETYAFYCASMLMLLKPWRNIETDLKSSTQTWESAFDDFMVNAPRKYRNILSGIQFFHECESSAKTKRSEEDIETEPKNGGRTEIEDDNDDAMEEDFLEVEEELYSEERLTNLMANATPQREVLHGRIAVEIAKHAHIFPEDASQWSVDPTKVGNATGDDFE